MARAVAARRTILPIFDKFQKEAEIIGRLVVGYGEIEFGVMACLAAALDDIPAAVRVMYRSRGEEQRFQAADALMRTHFDRQDLGKPYSEAFADANFCKKIRNQYAHCHWHSDEEIPFGFVALEESAKKTGKWIYPRRIDLSLIMQQEDYFVMSNIFYSTSQTTLK